MDISSSIMSIVTGTDAEWELFIAKLGRGLGENSAECTAVVEHFNSMRAEIQRATKRATPGDIPVLMELGDGSGEQENKKSKPDKKGGAPKGTPEKRSEGENDKQPESPLPKEKAPGHGKHSYRDYLDNAEVIYVLPDFPDANGTSFSEYQPAYRLVLTGSMSLRARVYVLPRRRLVCGDLQTTPLPKSVGPLYGNVDAEGVASLVFSHYKLGATHYGISALHSACGLPLSPSTQWDAIEKGANAVFRVHKELTRTLADAEVIQIDSTGKKVMSLKKEIEQRQADAEAAGKNPELVRHGVRTTAVLGTTQSQEKISVFVTGEEHAGEVLDILLEHRQAPEKVLLACDASSQNTDTKFQDQLLLCLCNAHAFRKFTDCAKDYPNQAPEIIATYGKIFENERFCVASGFQGVERLDYHFEHSTSLMMEIYQKLTLWLKSKLFTPKSAMGQAARYFLKHFEGLCAFLKYENAPLHNNADEIEIKVSVKHRKNSLFYQTETGAHIGDIWMSLIQTAILNKINPWNWIVALLKNPDSVAGNPKAWLPWNWKTLEGSV